MQCLDWRERQWEVLALTNPQSHTVASTQTKASPHHTVMSSLSKEVHLPKHPGAVPQGRKGEGILAQGLRLPLSLVLTL